MGMFNTRIYMYMYMYRVLVRVSQLESWQNRHKKHCVLLVWRQSTCVTIFSPHATSASVTRHRSLWFKIISAANLTAWLRPDTVDRSQVEREIVPLLWCATVDLATVRTHDLKAETGSVRTLILTNVSWSKKGKTSVFSKKYKYIMPRASVYYCKICL